MATADGPLEKRTYDDTWGRFSVRCGANGWPAPNDWLKKNGTKDVSETVMVRAAVAEPVKRERVSGDMANRTVTWRGTSEGIPGIIDSDLRTAAAVIDVLGRRMNGMRTPTGGLVECLMVFVGHRSSASVLKFERRDGRMLLGFRTEEEGVNYVWNSYRSELSGGGAVDLAALRSAYGEDFSELYGYGAGGSGFNMGWGVADMTGVFDEMEGVMKEPEKPAEPKVEALSDTDLLQAVLDAFRPNGQVSIRGDRLEGEVKLGEVGRRVRLASYEEGLELAMPDVNRFFYVSWLGDKVKVDPEGGRPMPVAEVMALIRGLVGQEGLEAYVLMMKEPWKPMK